MNQWQLHTEYSFNFAYGKIERVLDACGKVDAAAITDRHGTWGHVQWEKACKKRGIKPIFGVELAIVPDEQWESKQFKTAWISFLAKNNAGLQLIYELVTKATEQFYYIPRLRYADLAAMTSDVVVIAGPTVDLELLHAFCPIFVAGISPTWSLGAVNAVSKYPIPCVAVSDNLYPFPEDRPIYEIVAGRHKEGRQGDCHIVNDWVISSLFPGASLTTLNPDEFTAELPKAEMVHYVSPQTLDEMCRERAVARGIDLNDPIYSARLKRELDLIHDKQFEDYFFVIEDMLRWAKQRMLVGPARGSSCGSLVCYLLSITEIDPIPFDLLFERFIDINRKDLPDIDIDFPDTTRDDVFEYVRNKYGDANFARLGTVGKYKARSTIATVAKELNIPAWEVADLKNSIIERSTGDSRAQFCIADTFEQLDIGRLTLAKYPELAIASELEGHSSHSGQHAAGIIVTARNVSNFCSVDRRTGAAQVDKYDAESLNLLKIDALGLRTLSVIQDCLDQVGWSREQLMKYPLEDKDAFAVINAGRFAGIFQFEGLALQSLCKQMVLSEFEDVVSLTALARPGPLNSGGATEWLKRRMGKSEVKWLHPLCEPHTKVSYGVVVYQEQVMQIAREVGSLSWEDVSSLRKAMSKSLGKEFFDQYWLKFKEGTDAKGIRESDAQHIWDNINTMGSWAFNRSHAVAYGVVSYWCMVLKAKFPLQYAAACLRHAKDDEQCIRLLRELDREGFKYRAFHPEKSTLEWSVQDGELLGGLLGVKGIGAKIAADIVARRNDGRDLTPRHQKLIANASTPYDVVFEGRERFGHIYNNPLAHNIVSPLTYINDITQDSNGIFVLLAKVVEKDLRDHNEQQYLVKRNGRKMEGQTLFLNLTLEDDTGTIIGSIDRLNFERYGRPLIEEGKLGDWYVFKGINRAGFRRLKLERWVKL